MPEWNTILQMLEQAAMTLSLPVQYVTGSTERISYLFLLTALMFALYVYLRTQVRTKPFRLSRFIAFCFPRRVFLHKSALVDYGYFVVNTIAVHGVLFVTVLVGLFTWHPWVTETIRQLLTDAFGPSPWTMPANDPGVIFAYTLVLMLAVDFALFISHYLMHKVPFLWEFHKVHHSAQVLTPITVYRMHPVDDIHTSFWVALCVGLSSGVFYYAVATEAMQMTSASGIPIVTFLFYLFAYNLRHSHIRLAYPEAVEKWFISPAQHQIHHSSEPRHFDKNFGFMLGCWDRMFGSLYPSRDDTEFRLGLHGGEDAEYDSVWKCYVLPFKKAFRLKHKWRWARVAMIGVAVMIAMTPRSSLGSESESHFPTPPSLHLEDLTWTEVRDALAQGYTAAIIPTGGTEQNGPHMPLGKHNLVVKHTAEAIAARLGRTLVAPVMSYVPQGNISPPQGHMHFAGTLSIPEDVFASVLEHTARSLKQHGFMHIYFIGDSYHNQPAQAGVAALLSEEWASEGITVLHVAEYYAANGQADWLKAEGFTDAQVGTHAGIRDTSEVMAIAANAIRMDRRTFSSPQGFEQTGVAGDPTLASAEIGKMMLELKVEAAVEAIRAAVR